MSTTQFIRAITAGNARFYWPVLLHGFFYVGAAVSGIAVFMLKEWKTHENAITPLDVKIFWGMCLWTALTNCLSFASKKVAEADAKKKEHDQALPG